MGVVRNLRRTWRLLASDSTAETVAAVVLLAATFGPGLYTLYQSNRRA